MSFQFDTATRELLSVTRAAQVLQVTNGAYATGQPYSVGETVTSGGNSYRCITAITSSTTAPTGTAASITDGSGAWTYAPPTLVIYSSAESANCAASSPTGVLATLELPMVPFTTANGTSTMNGTWAGVGSAAGTAASFRIFDAALVCRQQGNTTTDLVLDNESIALNQPVQIQEYQVTEDGA